ncbi:uncharacterized protein GGS22DRAFT_105568 [Annulohypoxylon maeteangense]|uniref:uncharacterized protein n=1 Tax=Annulohypoxylon maeteangense TaxID=1927788 RepID=UPI0020073D49|nr:uncharacterized protein GGS22DRAFT_105568 [Annulohypoxylon maeteangense]KAI0887161.1 hypothetical protein GGS22DRAFT_105568 [Annulohypoxylon maeteangense]
MASVASASPSSRHSFPMESGDDSDSWQYVESNPASVGFMPSPASSSMHSWGIVGYPNQMQASPVAMSPLQLDHDQARAVPPTSYPDSAAGTSMMASAGMDGQLMPAFDEHQFIAGQEMIFNEQLTDMDMTQYYSTFQGSMTAADMSGLEGFDVVPQPVDLGIPQQFRNDNNVPPWAPMNLKNEDFASGVIDETNSFTSQSPRQVSPTHSSHHSSPRSPYVKSETGKGASPIRKVRNGYKVEKKKSESSSKFVIMTPNLINQQSGKPNLFECFDTMRTTQRGRKGPLAHDTKESALQVRRLGACFCCHSRKVKCDKERPCKNCKKLSTQVPQIMCWQFGDFLPVLFPDFIRNHFKKDQMTSFISDHVENFKPNGSELTCTVELFSGARFGSTLTIPASFFTPKSAEILQHWHMNMGMNQMDLQSRGAAPIGIDPENSAQREELKRRAREYVHNLSSDPMYAEQVTDAIRCTQLPKKVLTIIQRYAQRSESTQSSMVKRALSIYVMHYVLTRQLCLTQPTLESLKGTNMVPHNNMFLTARVLNRQIKAVLDEMLLREMQLLFDGFSKSLKPKLRREWGPCLAAFLVLCLFMETVETAADTFVISQNEIAIRNRSKPEYKRDFALSLCREIDNMPFKQFAYQFHQIYQTHTRDTGAKAFNPLVDGNLSQIAELDDASAEMVRSLKELLQGDSWHELDFLVADPILPNQEGHPFPRDVSLNYTGRLVARFLLSFTDERYLFDGQY